MTPRRGLRFTALTVVVAGLSLLGAACGDDDDDGGEALTEAAFLEQANQICTDGEAALDAEAEAAFSEEPTAETIEAFMEDAMVPSIQGQIDDIRALAGPDDLEDDVDEALDAAQERLDEIDAMDGDEVLALFATGEDPFEEVNAQLDDVGLTSCGSSEE